MNEIFDYFKQISNLEERSRGVSIVRGRDSDQLEASQEMRNSTMEWSSSLGICMQRSLNLDLCIAPALVAQRIRYHPN
jgi:hypothetical protein